MFIKFLLVLVSSLLFFNCGYEKSFNIKSEQSSFGSGLMTVDVYDMSFKIPQNMEKQNIQGRDNLVMEYSNDEMSVSFESGIGSRILKNLKTSDYVENYKERKITNQDNIGIQAEYQYAEEKTKYYKEGKKFATVVSFDCNKEGNSVTFWIFYKHPTSNRIAEKIVDSISLNCS